MGKYIVIALVIIILIGGGYFLIKGKSNTQQSTQSTQTSQQSAQPSAMKTQPSSASMSGSAEGGNAFSYTENGFQPHSITIKKGQTVIWTNKDSDELWVASNPHPTHTD